MRYYFESLITVQHPETNELLASVGDIVSDLDLDYFHAGLGMDVNPTTFKLLP